MSTSLNSFNARATLSVGGRDHEIFRLDSLATAGYPIEKLPFTIRVLLECLLRTEDGMKVTADDVRALAGYKSSVGTRDIAFMPARVLLQDFTGVPAVVDLAAMRDAMRAMGGDPDKINPLQPVDLVIDHSVQVDAFGTDMAFDINRNYEYQRNRERYAFLRWAQKAFTNFRAVPPDTGIVHQVNLEYLASVAFVNTNGQVYPDTVIGTDSHTTMINGLGVLGWGVGGIEAEAAMLGQPMSMVIPPVVGFRLHGRLPEGATATDLVLTVTQILRSHGVVGKFVEFFGRGLATLPLADRATIANMAPEYGATCGFFPVDDETLRFMRFSGRDEELVQLTEAYMKEQGLFHSADSPEAEYTETLELDLSTVEPSLAGPRRPQDRVALFNAKSSFIDVMKPILNGQSGEDYALLPSAVEIGSNGDSYKLHHGSVVIAAITSCTNTSNPSVMVAAGLLAKNAVSRGLASKPWVKTSLAPGSQVVTEYLHDAGLDTYLNQLGFQTVGYGCTTCIGNSGPLPQEVSAAVNSGDLVVCSVLSGNRNFEGRVNQDVKANYLASPPLVVAYALAGRMDINLQTDPLGTDQDGREVYLRDIWPSQLDVQTTIEASVRSEMYRGTYASVFAGDAEWNALEVPEGELFRWEEGSTYVKHPPYFVDMPREASDAIADISRARVLAVLGDSITTDHISPAGNIKRDTPAGRYLMENGIDPADFNSYGSRRGNHEVMMRGTFANIRLRNRLAPGTEGGFTTYLPTNDVMAIYDAAMLYKEQGTPLVVLAGREYGSGSSRDWAAKGTLLLGVKAVIAESFERIHRSNLVGMGVLPMQFVDGQNAESLGLGGRETFDITGLATLFSEGFPSERRVSVRATDDDGNATEFSVAVRIDTPQEVLYYKHGGILQYVLRDLLNGNEHSNQE